MTQSRLRTEREKINAKKKLLTHRAIILDQTKEHDVLATESHGGVKRIFGFSLEHFVQQSTRHVYEILREKLIPVDGNQR